MQKKAEKYLQYMQSEGVLLPSGWGEAWKMRLDVLVAEAGHFDVRTSKNSNTDYLSSPPLQG